MDAEATVHRDADVLVSGRRIEAVGKGVEAPAGTDILDAADHLVLPGLIQGHLHLGQTLFRGLAERRRLLPWLRERIWPLEGAHDDDSAYWSARAGAAECLLGGTTTIQDIGIGPGAEGLLNGIADSGLRAQAGMCLMDEGEGLPESLGGRADEVLNAAERLGAQFEIRDPERLRYVLNPRFILSCSDALWAGIRQLAGDRGWPVHTHALEQEEEGAAVMAAKGRDEIEYFDENGILDSTFCIAHGVWMSPNHRRRVESSPFSVVHCPSSNLKLGSGIADLIGLREAGIPVGVGADGAPCNNDLDGFEEVRLAALLQSLRHGPDGFSGLDALRLATSEGARAIGWDSEIGSLEAGKRADVIVLDAGGPEFIADESVDPHDLVVFSASRSSVRDVFLGGRQMVRGGELVSQDLPEITVRSRQSLTELIRRSGLEL
ncbi:MAG: amidohydrolase family protein [Thermoanaerobaculia bacterium]